ncbi:MAG: hypothetical protein WBJ85_02540 [Acetomicrobium sp.]|jgi:polyhydroxyalkanoate synthesis regulator phasin|uniref:hypothetical protein n=1 Tax=Acetomicrobium TaxID=49894 RepID=UPI001699B3BD|nr:hypothetical protein [Acetomicrobium mobile]MBP8675325.1 hypothetical protein [Acetomicrobium sp.]MDI9376755.1 hypothetical protein [Synergistota bacterium]NLI42903.1 hypothetical protein [Synergistaceae bacterium]HOB11407.1 hypothetical protein [Acetomicrobium sp.]HOM96893.1 hypothetical protein [Acetomicrobium sp.]
MDSIIQLLLGGFGVSDDLISLCRSYMSSLVEEGAMERWAAEKVLMQLEEELARRRDTLVRGFKNEIEKFLSFFPLVTIEQFEALESRVKALEEQRANL